VFLVFLRLGLTSFGGPVAHLGFFREAFVVRRRWLGERAYAELVALCQFLPGPASSQVGMALGLRRAGPAGMAAAWLGFTLPSAVLMVAFAAVVSAVADVSGAGWVLGLKAAAVAVVAQAVTGMARTLAPDRRRATILAAAAVAALLAPGPLVQVAVIAASGLVGWAWLRDDPLDGLEERGAEPPSARVPRAVAVGALVAWVVLLVGLPLVAAAAGGGVRLFAVFDGAGSLAFGGGHVVLPLLETQLVPTHLVSHDAFLAGYGAAQAVPGPLFTFAAYLGAIAGVGPGGVAGAAVALVGIFLPGALLVVGALPWWESLRGRSWARRALSGVNAGVVGLLAAAFYDPVVTEGIGSVRALALAVAAFVALTRWSVPPWAVVVASGVLGTVLL
jgi:chromate transporter